ncbi:MAG TPA: TetR/AcrR family transcriptional regulator [Kofleriaceae bacterium]|nr:TetR/AcrR family transcriptional regulator [Kofleriaceae bacterium]
MLDAALRMFAERGYHGTTVPDVAEAAGVATGTLYHYFAHKEELVNEVYRDAKQRLRSALLDDLPEPRLDEQGAVERWFHELWRRLAAFARREPAAFRFLEMQDHVEYLDAESRQLELATVSPIFMVAQRVSDRAGGSRVDIVIALMWGAFVGLVKANRLGYLALDDTSREGGQPGAAGSRRGSIDSAGDIVWRMFGPEAQRAFESYRTRS